jgi:hypothetical protein
VAINTSQQRAVSDKEPNSDYQMSEDKSSFPDQTYSPGVGAYYCSLLVNYFATKVL